MQILIIVHIIALTKYIKYKIMKSLSSKGKWVISESMVLFYTVAFFGAIALIAIFTT